jgi:outer membrane receptor protein involved in Fe transport
VDPVSASLGFTGMNPQPLAGAYTVKEAFAEVVVPLLRDVPLIKSLEFNGAVRLSDYSSIGSITTWKVGLNHQVTNDLRLRATRSRDIRAPNLSDLFAPSQLLIGPIQDPVTGQTVSVNQFVSGNPNLGAERADTTTVGAIYRPSWISGLNLSVDYYAIKIEGVIVALGGQPIVDRCKQGNTALCALITRTNGVITRIDRPSFNLNVLETSGVDVELAYTTGPISESLPGRLRFRLLANYVDKLITDDGVTRLDNVGDLGTTQAGVPRWRGSLSAAYVSDTTSANARVRYVHSGLFDHTRNIDANEIGREVYVDLGVEQSLDSRHPGKVVLYGNVRNLFDNDPPNNPSPVHYDIVGRYMTVGVRFAL